MGMTAAAQDTEVMAEINITPLTDVLLVLLIIFMILAALAAPPGFQKEFPKKNTAPQTVTQSQLKRNIDVRVTAKNVIYIDGKRTDMSRLYGAMVDAVTFHKSHASQGYLLHVSLISDQDANFDTIIKILDAARQAGDDDVGFVTQ